MGQQNDNLAYTLQATSYWDFVEAYATDRYGDDWCISPQQSLLLAIGDTCIPDQLVIHAPGATNDLIDLPTRQSVFNLKADVPNWVDTVRGIRCLELPAALVLVPASFFEQHPVAARLALQRIASPFQVLEPLLVKGNPTVAGRLAGAFRHIGKDTFADKLVSHMRVTRYDVAEVDPFVVSAPALYTPSTPLADRVTDLWRKCRQDVIDRLPPAPGRPVDTEAFLDQVGEVFQADAYHSLTIEGYRVSPELIESVARDETVPDDHDALAAKGYREAFLMAGNSLREILEGNTSTDIVERDHATWYRALFSPSVRAGILKPQDLAGYRNHPVYLMTSDYVPPRPEAVMDGMSALFDCILNEIDYGARAVLAHWLFGYIHPFPDGNGRTARLLMNVLLADGGYPWTIVRSDDRMEYLAGLNAASLSGNIGPFADLMAKRISAAMEERPSPDNGMNTP